MLSEQILSLVTRQATQTCTNLAPAPNAVLPPPKLGHRYLLYLHIPFCESLCPYCSFNRFVYGEDVAREYFVHLRREMYTIAKSGYQFSSMYIGGGTPTVLPDELSKTIDLACELFGVREVSCETNPNHLTREIVSTLDGRVHRLSVGVQSFDDRILKQINRFERFGSGKETLERIRVFASNFPVFNIDLIYNFPRQTLESFINDIHTVISSGANQVTFYPLMTSSSVDSSLQQTMGRHEKSNELDFYQIIDREIKGDFEMASAWAFTKKNGNTHNSASFLSSGPSGTTSIDEYIVDYDEYVGIGSGAFSYLNGCLYVNTFSLREYRQLISSQGSSVVRMRRFSTKEQMRYRFMMQLFGLSLDKHLFQRDYGVSIESGLPAEMAFMRFVDAFERDDDVITLTDKGRYLLVAMMREFFSRMNDIRELAREALTEDERQLAQPESWHTVFQMP